MFKSYKKSKILILILLAIDITGVIVLNHVEKSNQDNMVLYSAASEYILK